MEQAGMAEMAGDPHEHRGVSDAHAEDPGHGHGDPDDHHETPDSPCHHHVVHCCCSHSHGFIAESLPGLPPTGPSRRISSLIFQDELPPLPKSIFHIPIA